MFATRTTTHPRPTPAPRAHSGYATECSRKNSGLTKPSDTVTRTSLTGDALLHCDGNRAECVWQPTVAGQRRPGGLVGLSRWRQRSNSWPRLDTSGQRPTMGVARDDHATQYRSDGAACQVVTDGIVANRVWSCPQSCGARASRSCAEVWERPAPENDVLTDVQAIATGGL
jgi:hypothetical protein